MTILFVKKAQDQLSEDWIIETYKRGEDFARGFSDIGRNGDYDAKDWIPFGASCVKSLEQRRDRCIEASKKLLRDVYPTLVSEAARGYSTLGGTVNEWIPEIQEQCKSVEDALNQIYPLLNQISEGAAIQNARDNLQTIIAMVTAAFQQIFSRTQDAQQDLKDGF